MQAFADSIPAQNELEEVEGYTGASGVVFDTELRRQAQGRA